VGDDRLNKKENEMMHIFLPRKLATDIYNKGDKSRRLSKEESKQLLDIFEERTFAEGDRVVLEMTDQTFRHWLTTLKSGKTGDYRNLAFEIEGAFAAALGDALQEDLRWGE
jgi:hypothetical protein